MGGGNGKLVFSSHNKPTCSIYLPNLPENSQNVLVSNWDFTDANPITIPMNKGVVQLQNVSPDGTKLIIYTSFDEAGNGSGYLSVVNIKSKTNPVTIAPYINENAYRGFPTAFWVDNSRIVYMGMYGGVNSILMVNSDGTNLKQISKSDQNVIPFRILYADEYGIYWSSFSSQQNLSSAKIWWSSIDGSQQNQINIDRLDPSWWDRYQVSLDGKWILWYVYHLSEKRTDLYIASLSNTIGNSHLLGTIPYPSYSILFSSDGRKAVLLPPYGSETTYQDEFRSSYKIFSIYSVSLDTQTLNTLFVPKYDQLADIYGSSPLFESLSPDGRFVLAYTWVIDHSINTITAWNYTLINLETQTTSEVESRCLGYVQWLPNSK